MATYRGVNQRVVAQSIMNAVELIRENPIGPAAAALLDKLTTIDPGIEMTPIDALAEASNDIELASLVRAAGTGSLMMLAPIFHFHGMDDTGGKGLAVFKGLSEWGGLSGARMMAYTPLDAEMESYLVLQYAKKVASGAEGPTLKERFMMNMEEDLRKGAVFFSMLSKLVQVGAGDDDIKNAFLELDLGDRHKTVEAGAFLCRMHYAQKNLHAEHQCMTRYGVDVPDLSAGKINWSDPSLKAIRLKVEEALDPFYDTDEVDMTGVGLIGEGPKSPQGIIFNSTKNAAQAVANALPEFQVIDYKGNWIPPKTPSKPRFSGPKL